MKRILSFVILLGMMVHGVSRLGFITYVYSHRHDLAYTLGIATERAISICKSDYFQHSTLPQFRSEDSSVPAGLPQAQEIILGYLPAILGTPEVSDGTKAPGPSGYSITEYCPPYSEIFHPPLI